MKWPQSAQLEGATIRKANEREFLATLESFLDERGIRADVVQEEWFPEVECDVFISHSSDDQNAALAFAGWLSLTFGITAFVDSIY